MSQRKRLRRLFDQDPRCTWCGELTRHPSDCRPERGPHPDDMATLDHLDEKGTPMDGMAPGVPRTVLACRKCNRARDAERLAHLQKLKQRQAERKARRERERRQRQYAEAPRFVRGQRA